MSARFEELAWAPTPIGEISLRRRLDPVTRQDVYEVKLNDEWLMSSQFTAAEIELSRVALERVDGEALAVVVGGLGLGYTAKRALEDARVAELAVVELLSPVIDWHERALVPLGADLAGDERCTLRQGDFFAMAAGDGFDPEAPGRQWDAIALDIDHSPQHLLADGSASFYGEEGTAAMVRLLRPGGAYAMWSNDPPEQWYLDVLATALVGVEAEVITFPNPLQGRDATATIYSSVRA